MGSPDTYPRIKQLPSGASTRELACAKKKTCSLRVRRLTSSRRPGTRLTSLWHLRKILSLSKLKCRNSLHICWKPQRWRWARSRRENFQRRLLLVLRPRRSSYFWDTNRQWRGCVIRKKNRLWMIVSWISSRLASLARTTSASRSGWTRGATRGSIGPTWWWKTCRTRHGMGKLRWDSLHSICLILSEWMARQLVWLVMVTNQHLEFCGPRKHACRKSRSLPLSIPAL